MVTFFERKRDNAVGFVLPDGCGLIATTGYGHESDLSLEIGFTKPLPDVKLVKDESKHVLNTYKIAGPETRLRITRIIAAAQYFLDRLDSELSVATDADFPGKLLSEEQLAAERQREAKIDQELFGQYDAEKPTIPGECFLNHGYNFDNSAATTLSEEAILEAGD